MYLPPPEAIPPSSGITFTVTIYSLAKCATNALLAFTTNSSGLSEPIGAPFSVHSTNLNPSAATAVSEAVSPKRYDPAPVTVPPFSGSTEASILKDFLAKKAVANMESFNLISLTLSLKLPRPSTSHSSKS